MTRMPDLFIVGAPKSGTTSLYEYLKGHPDVFMSVVKEPCYFSRDLAADKSGNFLRYDVDRARYLALFEGAGEAKRVGEASTRYLYSKDAAGLIAAEQPDARIVAILRNPVDMIASLHAHKLAGGTEDLETLEAALDAESDRHAGRRIPGDSNPFLATYRDRARFGEQVPRWFDAFGRERPRDPVRGNGPRPCCAVPPVAGVPGCRSRLSARDFRRPQPCPRGAWRPAEDRRPIRAGAVRRLASPPRRAWRRAHALSRPPIPTQLVSPAHGRSRGSAC